MVRQLASYRRFYLYAALTIALVAASAGLGNALTVIFHGAGLGIAPSEEERRRAVSLAIATLAIAVPIGGAHLFLVQRSLRDAAEAASRIRDFFLSGWLSVSLLVAVLAGRGVAIALAGPADMRGDVAEPLAFGIVALAIALAAWLWRRATPTDAWPSLAWGYALVAVAMAMAASDLAGAVSAAAALATEGDTPYGFVQGRAYLEQTAVADAAGFALGLGAWLAGLRWTWPRRTSRVRIVYLVGAYAVGTSIITASLSAELATLDRYARGVADLFEVSLQWAPLAAGVLLVGVHVGLLLLDRGRNGHPPVVVTRFLAGIPALVGLTAVVAAAVLWWLVVVDQLLLPAFADVPARDQAGTAAATTLVGLAVYLGGWWRFLGATRAEPQSAQRRFYLYTVICLALAGTVIAGSVALYNGVSLALADTLGARHEALLWSVPALVGALVFAAHLLLLRRDSRAARPEAAVAIAAGADPLEPILERVARGELAPHDAVALVRRAAGAPAH